jgi:iron complex outermembrane recepter protein
MMKKIIPIYIVALFPLIANAQDAEKIDLNPVVVTATRTEINSFDAPAAVDVVSQSQIEEAGWGMVLSESLNRVAGVEAVSRNHYAQDPMISIRGFGARSTFGVTGVRLLVDGIPFTMPDGIGQPGNIDFELVKSIEVLKGPFATLYGNGSGGVISMTTIDPAKTTEASFNFMAGSYGTTKEAARLTGTVDGVGYIVNESNFNTDGYRDHSWAHKKQSTVAINFDLQNDTHVTVLADYLKMEAQDPLGLAGQGSNTQVKNGSGTLVDVNNYNASYIPDVRNNPTGVPLSAIGANTRVYRENTQVGVNIDHTINNNNSIDLVVYGGHRNNNQYLSTSTSLSTSTTQCGFTHVYCGKDSTISRDFIGADLSWKNKGKILDKDYSVVTGVAYAYMTDYRQDSTATNGVLVSPLSQNRRENDNAINLDEYVQGQLSLTSTLDLHLGVRNLFTENIFKPLPLLSGGTNKTTYSSLHFNNTTPSVGLLWKATDNTNFYADVGKGFQTPNNIQMAYSNSSGVGPNTGLSGSSSDNYEIGLKSFINENTRVNLALFKINASKEIEILSGGSYTVYHNLPVDTSRNGFEASIDSILPYHFELYAAYTYLDAKFDGSFTLPGKTGVTNLPVVQSGNRIPGMFNNQFYGEVSWAYPALGFKTAFETVINSRQYANDFNTAYANGYGIANIRATFEQKLGSWRINEFARIDNLFDKNYISAVRINDSNGEYYEAGSGRSYMVGGGVTYVF